MPLVVGVHFRVVAWPAVKVYPPLGILKGLAVLEAATTAAKTATIRQMKARILIKIRVVVFMGFREAGEKSSSQWRAQWILRVF